MSKRKKFYFLSLLLCLTLMLASLGTAAASQQDLVNGVTFKSIDSWESESQFLLRYEKVPAPVGLSAMDVAHGAYLIRDDVQSGSYTRSFDYSSSESMFTVYGPGGAWYTLRFQNDGGIDVHDLDAGYEVEGGTYYWNATEGAYMAGSNKLPGYVVDGLRTFLNNGQRAGFDYEGKTPQGTQEFSVMNYPEEQLDGPEYWYKVTNVNDASDWVAFTYDASRQLFTMYQNDGTNKPYSYRRFRSDGTLEVKGVSFGVDATGSTGANTGIYSMNSNGEYESPSDYAPIKKYVTDGMKVFLYQLNH